MPGENDIASYKAALLYAISIIESYQMDIRNNRLWSEYMTTEYKGKTLEQLGFCQGRIYKRAIEAIKKMTGEE